MRRAPIIAWSVQTVIDRRDYGLVWSLITEAGAVVAGNEVRIEISIEAKGRARPGS